MKTYLSLLLALSFSQIAVCETSLDPIVVNGRGLSLLGVADSVGEGEVGLDQLKVRPFARPGEVMETIPGMIITQHAGGGKANQYYLRGFNLDHGTDFATYVDGVPLNLPTHAHGQGYTDSNWLIPELIQSVRYFKGPYYAEYGDFATTGAADISYVHELPQPFVTLQGGNLGYLRALAAGSHAMEEGHLLYALEVEHNDGAWNVPNDYKKINALAKWSHGTENSGYSLTAQAYQGQWRSTDQVPERAIDQGLIGRYGTLDDSDGGLTHRLSAYGEWHRKSDQSSSHVNVYLVHYDLDLYSDFTDFLNQATGDQIVQRDNRTVGGFSATHSLYGKIQGLDDENTFGLEGRYDYVGLSLGKSQSRNILNTVRADHVGQLNVAPWYQNKLQITSWLRTVAGARVDVFEFKNNSSDTEANSGSKAASAFSPKLSVIFGPWTRTEIYLQGGYGLRSNDTRGVLSTVNPGAGPTPGLAPIVRSLGAEVGVRTEAVKNLNTTVSLWYLKTDSEAYFQGDSGSVEDSGHPGRRTGIEWTNFYQLTNWLALDADFAVSNARFTDDNPAGSHIPEAISSMASAGITLKNLSALPRFFASLRLRYLGPRDLIEDASQKSKPSTVLNALAGYTINSHFSATLEVLNLTDTHYNDAEYYYSARLKGEAAGTAEGGGTLDHMVHAGEPLSVRAGLTAYF